MPHCIERVRLRLPVRCSGQGREVYGRNAVRRVWEPGQQMNRGQSENPEAQLPLHQAAVAGRADEVARLLAQGADATAVDATLRTPLHAACQQGHLEAARVLVAAGARIDARDSFGNTPLWRAVFAFQGGEPELIRLLLEAGADPDSKNNSDRSPRDMALTFDRPGIRAVFP
jgi:uncharacterized protein